VGGQSIKFVSRTAILAAANPVGGHYNRAKTVSENLRLGPALLSRFDLVRFLFFFTVLFSVSNADF
jgi:DNA helicase MCM8